MGNYVSMEQSSRSALDQMTRDIRKSKNLLSFATNQLVFNYNGTTNLIYAYDPATRRLTRRAPSVSSSSRGAFPASRSRSISDRRVP